MVWLSVRGQRPFHAPAGWALALLALLAVLALGVTAQLTDRAATLRQLLDTAEPARPR